MHGNFKRIFRLIILAINLYGLYITCLETLFIRVNSILSFSHSRKRVVVYIEKDLIALIIQFLINMLYTFILIICSQINLIRICSYSIKIAKHAQFAKL